MTEIAGWLDPQVAVAMRQLILKEQPEVVVEIGVYAGKSLINSALALKENGHGKIYGIDPWRTRDAVQGMAPEENVSFWANTDLNDVHTACMCAIWEHEVEDYVVIIRARSQDCVDCFDDSEFTTTADKKIDILYIDGAHSEQSSCLDVSMYLPKVENGGYIWVDDTDYPSLQKALAMLDDDCKLIRDFGRVRLYQKL